MKNRLIVGLIRVSIIFLFAVGLGICALWYPFSISLDTVGVVQDGPDPITLAQRISFWMQLIFMWAVSVPCFYTLHLFFRSTGYAKHDEVFCRENARLYRKAAIALLVGSVALIAGNVLFIFLEWNSFATVYIVLGAVGLVCSLACYVVYRYILKAAAIQEENDSIL